MDFEQRLNLNHHDAETHTVLTKRQAAGGRHRNGRAGIGELHADHVTYGRQLRNDLFRNATVRQVLEQTHHCGQTAPVHPVVHQSRRRAQPLVLADPARSAAGCRQAGVLLALCARLGLTWWICARTLTLPVASWCGMERLPGGSYGAGCTTGSRKSGSDKRRHRRKLCQKPK